MNKLLKCFPEIKYSEIQNYYWSFEIMQSVANKLLLREEKRLCCESKPYNIVLWPDTNWKSRNNGHKLNQEGFIL